MERICAFLAHFLKSDLSLIIIFRILHVHSALLLLLFGNDFVNRIVTFRSLFIHLLDIGLECESFNLGTLLMNFLRRLATGC
jgi:hypothetical protein